MQTATQLDLFSYSPLAEGATAPIAGIDTRPWLTSATLWQLLKPSTCRVVIFHQHGDAAVAIAARTLGAFLAAGKETDTLYRIGITNAAHTFALHGEHSGGPITIRAGQGLCIEYRARQLQGAAIFADRAGVDTRRWAWYFGKVHHVRLEPIPRMHRAQHQDARLAA